ncbi:DUF262 domain-containing protein [Micromonospora tulbaghiae]|uniref:DUF262 domain-containing protein n=1 Tax=Micromonospora tulbaghiae TaxID=479978 RepID=UPI0034239A03
MSEFTVETQVPVDDRSGEGEEDVVDRLGAQRANVTAADWTIETIVTQLIKGRIDLDPAFQRRAAWTPALKSKFIESCILAYPIPQIVLAEKLDRPGHFFVIDGKQRLLALRQFYAGLPSHSSDDFKPYRLSTVTAIQAIKNFGIERLQRERPELFDAFETHTIRTVVIRNWGSQDFLYALFLRLNTGSVPLSPQELRQALVPGPFVRFADEASGESRGLRALLGNSGPDRRMIDAELLIRLIGLFAGPIPYGGNLKDFLDKTCAQLNAGWDSYELPTIEVVAEMELAIEALVSVFGENHACRKWSKNKFERAFNRALFDVQVGSLLSAEAREAALRTPERLVEGHKRLCNNDPQFVRSITSTTKTPEAFFSRFDSWSRMFAEETGVMPPWPQAISIEASADE